jgi:glycosyltransferase involved in cell wall biosynthesis
MTPRKRILIIDNLAVESSRRGVYRLLGEIAECDVHLLVPRSWRETTSEIECEEERSNTLDLHISRILFGYRHHRVVYTDLFRLIRKLHPDFVLAVHAPENYATLQLLAARRFLLPTMKVALFASRNIDLPAIGLPYKFAFINSVCDWIASRSKVDVVYHRPKSFGHLYQRYTKRPLYIPHSVDCLVFKPIPSKRHRGSGDVTFGYVGRLVKEKGVHILIQAFAKLPMQAHLVIAGGGPQLEHLHSLARNYEIAERTTFEPPVPYSTMHELLNRLDVLVLPSLETAHWKELFGRILVEAMACELPVVASDSGGIPEVVGEAGILFKSGNVRDLEEKLLDLLGDPVKRRELGKKGRARVLSSFHTPIVAETLAQDIAHNLRQ